MGDISYNETAGGVIIVRFPKDRTIIDDFKQAFPRARFRPAERAWLVPPGKTALRRVTAWAERQLAKQGEAAVVDQQAKQAATAAPIQSRHVRQDYTSYTVITRYNEPLVALLRQLPGARFERGMEGSGGFWRVPFRAADQLKAALPEIERLADIADRQEAAKRAEWQRQRDADRQAYQARRDQEQAEHAERRSKRHLFLVSDLPPRNQPLRNRGQIVVYTDYGKEFRISEDDPSIHGHWLLGHEGELGRYAYYRDATATEIAEVEAREATARQRDQQRQSALSRLHDIITVFERDGERPTQVAAPVGETVLQRDRRLAIYGGGSQFVAADDGLWYIQGNGGDGDDWSRNNLPGAIGCRRPRDAALEDELRRLAPLVDRQ